MSPELFVEALRQAAISPYNELLSYEQLYAQKNMSLKKITNLTVGSQLLPSEVVKQEIGMVPLGDYEAIKNLIDSKLQTFSVAINMTPSWPTKLAASERPSPLLYYRGDIGLLDLKSVSVVGARKATSEGIARAKRIAKELTEKGICVVTGLAEGIDTAASSEALKSGGKTIGVIGTPIDEYYPKKNKNLQDYIAAKHLLVSQVPFYRYSTQPFTTKKYYFPERNELMAAISDATVIVEASDTSGTLTQARACLHQNRPLFIMKSCFENPDIKWPERYLGKPNVHVLESVEQIEDAIG